MKPYSLADAHADNYTELNVPIGQTKTIVHNGQN